jgi:hypothetical protein
MSSSKDNLRRIAAARLALHKERMKAGRERATDKKRHQQTRAKLDVLLDDLKQEGVDVTTPDGQRILFDVILREIAESGEQDTLTGGDIFLR